MVICWNEQEDQLIALGLFVFNKNIEGNESSTTYMKDRPFLFGFHSNEIERKSEALSKPTYSEGQNPGFPKNCFSMFSNSYLKKFHVIFKKQ